MSSGFVHEEEVNIRLADALNELGLDCRPERVSGKRRPDIRCFYNGLIIGIEASYKDRDAEEDAGKRIDQGIVDLAIALHYPVRYPNILKDKLIEQIKQSQFNVKIITPKYVKVSSLLQFINQQLGTGRPLVTSGWFTVDIPTLTNVIRHATDYLIQESEIEEEIEKIKHVINNNFVNSLRGGGGVYREIYDVMYRLYGMQSPPTDEDLVLAQAALSLLLTATFYEHVRNIHTRLSPLDSYVRRYGPIEGFKKALDELLNIDYREAIKLAREILDKLPPNAADRVKELIEEGISIAQNRTLLRHDFAGRVYHEITGDIAVKKNFATFYTQVPAAYLLATLAVRSLLGLEDEIKRAIDGGVSNPEEPIRRIREIKVTDFACGSGTLLTASYSALMNVLTALKHYKELDINLDDLGKELIEKGIYGIDALKYAAQVTAINLALISPGNIAKENIHTIYLGHITGKNQPWLGSLELLNNGKRVGGILSFIEGYKIEGIEKVSLEGSEGTFELPEKFDLVIMNPPFTRATGRVSKEFREKEKGLFGFISEEKYRETLLERLNEIRDNVRDNLRSIAKNLAETENLPSVIKEIINGKREFKQYLNIGQAGEGLLFLYLAYKYVKPGGVIAFVLPRNVLSGVSWFLARALLAGKFHVRYVIVSSDTENGYNFSEGTSLSEALIVAKRVDEHELSEETKFIVLMKKPKSAVDAVILADKLLANNATYYGALIRTVPRSALLNTIINWNIHTIPDNELLNVIDNIINNGAIKLCSISVEIPITYFNNLISDMGVNRRGDIIEAFNLPKRGGTRVDCDALSKGGPIPNGVPMLCSGEEELRKAMLVKPNAWVTGSGPKAERITRLRSRLLVPDRIRWNTWRVIAVYSDEQLIANRFFMVKLKNENEMQEKALVTWLNTTFGLLTVLANREETEGGPFTEVNIGQWRALPILDITRLDSEKLSSLARVFDAYADKEFKRIPDQYGDHPDPARLSFDLDFLKALDSGINEDRAKQCLIELYKRLGITLKTWIDNGDQSL